MTNSAGGRKPRVTPEDVLDVFDAREDRAEPLTSNEVAEELPCTRRTALNRLHELNESGDVASKKVGGRSVVWWVPLPVDTLDARASADASTDTPPDGERNGTETSEDTSDGENVRK
ncbi:transcriptional regulator [Halopelagius fulvigenes]|uniref:Transcriptional regulator n=1 Tax=Halopelagius fulvigenes TaxID=1198324 RepID=A0ABD5TY86_9EURY